MVFPIIAILALMIILVSKKYRTLASVIGAIITIFAVTGSVLLWGFTAAENTGTIDFFNTTIGLREFYHLLAAWFAADVLCGALIIRNYINYKKVNKK